MKEEIVDVKKDKAASSKLSAIETIDLNNIETKNEKRILTNISELDRVLGGGIVPGSLILLGGEPGIGKSTLVAQIAGAVQNTNNVIYVSGEESASQVKGRISRLDIGYDKIGFLSEVNIEKIIATAEQQKPTLVIIDSIQTVYSSLVESEAGSITQIRACATKFLELAKQNEIAVILIGHITKDGAIAGPKSLEHIVDTVAYLETETTHDYRILRASKNRFGSVNELGVFEMTSNGFKEVNNPSAIFIENEDHQISGSVISCIIEGSRPFLIEVQALVTKTVFGYPQRKASGFDLNRLQVLIAVLSKRAKINLANQDVILNVVGGLKINDPSLDLAVCLAITSSLSDLSIDRKTLIFGEVGLGGEMRNVSKLEMRLNEGEKLGFTRAVVPNSSTMPNKKIRLEKIKNISEMVQLFKLK
ncbi:MAG: repair protein radA protein [Parcubacteria group bacterium GW2011_GWE2_38_18]|nr:MAG: repair protein radA protein [Parcubacteria group bacterium GW2011_GWE2_38_18]